jgi:hypothetical protein
VDKGGVDGSEAEAGYSNGDGRPLHRPGGVASQIREAAHEWHLPWAFGRVDTFLDCPSAAGRANAVLPRRLVPLG